MPDQHVDDRFKSYEALWRCSAMVDSVRDISDRLLHATPTCHTVAMLRGHYTQARADLAEILRSDFAAQIPTWSPDLNDRSGLDEVFAAAAQLARFIDTILQADGVAVQYKVGFAQARQHEVEAGKILEGLGIPGPSKGAGQYL